MCSMIAMPPKMKAAPKKRKVNREAVAGVKGLGAIGDSDSEQELERNFALIGRRDPEGRQETGGEAGDEPSGSVGCSEDEDVGKDQEVDPAEMSEDDDGASEECVTDSDSDGAAGPDSKPRARQSEEDLKKGYRRPLYTTVTDRLYSFCLNVIALAL